MSDGMYFFEGSSEKSKASGKVKINQGKFSGESSEYIYSGYFVVKQDKLQADGSLRNKFTEHDSKFEFSTSFKNDEYVTFSAEIEGEQFSFKLTKEEGDSLKFRRD